MMTGGAFGNSYKWARSASEVAFVLGSSSVTLIQVLAPVALGQDSTVYIKSISVCKLPKYSLLM